jgi:hypothetical protein
MSGPAPRLAEQTAAGARVVWAYTGVPASGTTPRVLVYASTRQMCDLVRADDRAAVERDKVPVTITECRQAVIDTGAGARSDYWAFTFLGAHVGVGLPAPEMCDAVRGEPTLRDGAPSACAPMAVQFLALR